MAAEIVMKSDMKTHSMLRELPALAALAAITLLFACDSGAPPVLGAAITIADAGATHPTVEIDGQRGIHYVAWVGVQNDEANVYVARSTDGQTFERHVRVNDIPGDAAPHEQAPAQVGVAPDGTVFVVWQNNQNAEGNRFPYSNLRLARSEDGGRTFEPAITINDDVTLGPSSHTFHDMIVARNGTVYVSWIDGRARAAAEREMAASAPPGDAAVDEHAGHEMEKMPPQEIRVARSTDSGRSFGPSTVVAIDPCPCCRTSLAITDDGAIILGWRGIFDGSIRDIVIARSTDGGTTFTAPALVHEDGWHIEGCPHAGPSIATTDDGLIHIAWYTGAEGEPGVYHAVSTDDGVTFGDAQPLLSGDWVPISRVQLAAAGDRLLGVWDDVRTDPAQPRIAWIGREGVASDTLATGGTFPVIAVDAGYVIAAWLEGDKVRARTMMLDGAHPSANATSNDSR
jgi:hypothetical protein